jgi:hypothetical protein
MRCPRAHGFQGFWGYLYHLDAMQQVSFPDINKTPTEQGIAPPMRWSPFLASRNHRERSIPKTEYAWQFRVRYKNWKMYYNMSEPEPAGWIMPLIPFHFTLVQNIKRDPFEQAVGVAQKSAMSIGGALAAPITAF